MLCTTPPTRASRPVRWAAELERRCSACGSHAVARHAAPLRPRPARCGVPRRRGARPRAGEGEGELELTPENVEAALLDARTKLSQLFDESIGMTGTCSLADLDGPFVTLRLKGRFWHPRGMVLARVGAYLQQRMPDIQAVVVEDEAQLDDSAANF